MIKDLLLAIVLGSLLGFGITGAFLAIRNNKTTAKTTSSITSTPIVTDTNKPTPSTPSPTSSPISPESDNIVIDTPQNNAIVSNSKVNLKGSTIPNSLVVVISPVKTYSIKSNDSGNFDLDIDLESGVNLVKITSISPTDLQSETQIIITYSTATI